jgi:uncharacterized protein YabE (DUF348 family)
MERNKRIYLCLKSLINISNDLKDDFEDYSTLLLFVADRIAQKMEKELTSSDQFSAHGNGKIHNVNTTASKFPNVMDENVQLTEEEIQIEKEIDSVIEKVKGEITECTK